MAAVASVVMCPKDAGVETALRCSRCETPICPKCLVQTPVGARCKECARIVKSPIYVLKGQQLVFGIVAALGGGLAVGFVWALVLWQFQNGFLAFFLGFGLAWIFTKMLDFATRRKRGPVVVGLALTGIALAWSIQFLTLGWGIASIGLLAAGIGMFIAYQNLR